MSEEGQKLYNTKPKKSQLKSKVKSMSSSPNPMDPPPPPPPPPPPSSSSTLPPHKESFARRYKFVWPLLLTVNLAIGAYLFVRTKKKDKGTEDAEVAEEIPSAAVVTTSVVERSPIISPPLPEPVKVKKSISEDQQRELYKWMLEEKRKIKPKNPEEKKRLDEEKAILKQVIRSKSIPTI